MKALLAAAAAALLASCAGAKPQHPCPSWPYCVRFCAAQGLRVTSAMHDEEHIACICERPSV